MPKLLSTNEVSSLVVVVVIVIVFPLFGSSVDDSQAVAGLVIVVQRALACPQDQQNSQIFLSKSTRILVHISRELSNKSQIRVDNRQLESFCNLELIFEIPGRKGPKLILEMFC